MVPWIEAGDPLCHFGVDIMYLAQEHPPIQGVVVELAAHQMDLIHQTRDAGDVQKDNRMYGLEGPAKRVADSLLGITDYLRSGPLQWRHHASYEMNQLGTDVSAFALDEPLRTLCKLHSRFGTSVCLFVMKTLLLLTLCAKTWHPPSYCGNPLGRPVYFTPQMVSPEPGI